MHLHKVITYILVISLCIAFSINAFSQAKQGRDMLKEISREKPTIAEDIDLKSTAFSTVTRVGVSNLTGNVRSIALSGHHHTKYRYHRMENSWRLGAYYERIFHHTKEPNKVGTNARYIYGTYRLDYYILQRLTTFAGGGGYTDVVKGINQAGQGFGGFRFIIVRNERTELDTSIGYNYTYEDRVDPNPNKEIHSAMQEIKFAQKAGEWFTFGQRVECLEDVEDGNDVRVNSETSFKFDIVKHLAIVLGFNLKFDNRPTPGYKKLDTYTDFTLAVSF